MSVIRTASVHALGAPPLSKTTIPAVKAALATKTSKMSSPASRRNSVFTPQMTEADSV
jgi:hypothetical protein